MSEYAKVEVRQTSDGECSHSCQIGTPTLTCPFAVHELPGPSCPGPGTYYLVPEGKLREMEENNNAL